MVMSSFDKKNSTFNTRRTGSAYEDLACERIESEGMQILNRNYRVRIGEIDIIARDGEELVFIEVKYRKNMDFGGAEYAIPESKRRTIRRVAQWYMNQRGISPEALCRFDAVLINGSDMIHIRNAW